MICSQIYHNTFRSLQSSFLFAQGTGSVGSSGTTSKDPCKILVVVLEYYDEHRYRSHDQSEPTNPNAYIPRYAYGTLYLCCKSVIRLYLQNTFPITQDKDVQIANQIQNPASSHGNNLIN